MTNWERKSSYLLREIVKFRTYIDALQVAQAQKEKIVTEREGAKATTTTMTAPSQGDASKAEATASPERTKP